MPCTSCCFLLFLRFRKSFKEKSSENSPKIIRSLTYQVDLGAKRAEPGGPPGGNAGPTRGPDLGHGPHQRGHLLHRFSMPFGLFILPKAKNNLDGNYFPLSIPSHCHRRNQSGAIFWHPVGGENRYRRHLHQPCYLHNDA